MSGVQSHHISKKTSKYTSPSPRIIRRSRNPSQFNFNQSKASIKKPKRTVEYYRSPQISKPMVYIDNRAHFNQNLPKSGSMIASERVVSTVPNSPMWNSSLRAKQGKVIGQVSNSNSSLFNRLTSGATKFGIISNKNVKLKNTSTSGKIPKLIQIPKLNVKNAKILNTPQSSRMVLTTSNVKTSQDAGPPRQPLRTRVFTNTASSRKVFHSRPTSISKYKRIHTPSNGSIMRLKQSLPKRKPTSNSQIMLSQTSQVRSHPKSSTHRILQTQKPVSSRAIQYSQSQVKYTKKSKREIFEIKIDAKISHPSMGRPRTFQPPLQSGSTRMVPREYGLFGVSGSQSNVMAQSQRTIVRDTSLFKQSKNSSSFKNSGNRRVMSNIDQIYRNLNNHNLNQQIKKVIF